MTTRRPTFTIMAGVEIAGGQLATLHHGQIDSTHTYGSPAEAARHFVAQGAQWLHVADLDAAIGSGDNHGVVREIIRECGRAAHIQLVGGVRDADSLHAALATGAQRVVLDSAALTDLSWVASAVAEHPTRISVGITADGHRVFAPGSTLHGNDLSALVEQVSTLGARSFLVSDVDAKGLRKSSERHALEVVCHSLHGHVVADGGVFRLTDLHALTELASRGLDAAVIDAALYTGGFTYAEAVAAVQERFDMFFWGPPQA